MAGSLTLFTIPKPFTGLADVQQRNAIGSWVRLGPEVDVILCGDDPGVADAAHDLGARHAPHVERNAEGTPLVSDAFRVATNLSSARVLCYANADIVLLQDFIAALTSLRADRFLVCGQRWDVKLDTPVNLDSMTWGTDVRALALRTGHLHGPTGMDYFAFPRGLIGPPSMPPFAVGRAFWDNWMIFHARARGLVAIDVTPAVVVVHQDHGYHHAQGGKQAVWYGPEARRNRSLASEMLYPFTLDDVALELTPDGIRTKRKPFHLMHRAMSSVALAVRTRRTAREWLRIVLRGQPIEA